MTYSKEYKDMVLSLRSRGKSYNELKKILKIPKSTLSDWLSPHGWSQNIAKQLTEKAKNQHTIRIRYLNKEKKRHLNKIYEEAEEEAQEEFQALKYHPLFIASLCLYWGEGDRRDKSNTRLSNIDPDMIKLFYHFLMGVCQIDKSKIKASLLLYPDLNDHDCKNFWSEKTGINKDFFNKSVFIEGRHKTRRLPYGVCNITVSSTYLKRKILIWLKVLPKELLDEEYYKYAGIV
jgi:hypothetical protein